MSNLLIKKEIVSAIVERYNMSNKREPVIFKDLNNAIVTYEAVKKMKDDGEPLPANSPYESYTKWIADLEKSVASCEKSLEKIDEQKGALVALEYFIANAS